MGILSAFSIAAPAGILSVIMSKDSDVLKGLWITGQFFIVAASVFCGIAALCFYKQRSQLAWLYGQICLTKVLNDKKSVSTELNGWLEEADSWESWWSYSWGFTSLITGFVEYLFALFLLLNSQWHWFPAHLQTIEIYIFYAFPLAAVSIAALQYYVLTRYKDKDDYWGEFRSDLFKFLSRKSPLPHDGVYTRLKPSSIHGVGVFAIRDIPKGSYIFEPDDDRTVFIPASETKVLLPEIRRLYQDFCVLEGETYECPSNLNKLTPSWFLNHSQNPNVAADSSLKFYAIRDIKAGHELTTDYETYSENEPDHELD